MFLLGGVLIGPSLHAWYGMLNRFIPDPSSRGALLRLAADQLIFAPTFIPLVLVSILGMEGKLSEFPQKLKDDYWNSLVANWKLWIPFNFVNFRFIPGNFQVLFANGVSIVWNCYISFIGYKPTSKGSSNAIEGGEAVKVEKKVTEAPLSVDTASTSTSAPAPAPTLNPVSPAVTVDGVSVPEILDTIKASEAALSK
jgi:hypothetical protein